MEPSREESLNQTAYHQLRDFIGLNYPHGRFVGIAGGKIIADADTFKELDDTLNRLGFTSPDVLVAEAGVAYPEEAIIFHAPFMYLPANNPR